MTGPNRWGKSCFVRGWVAFCVVVMLAVADAGSAEAHVERYDIHIVETRLGAALTALALQTDKQLFFPYDLAEVQGIRPVSGNYTVDEALELMLRDMGLSGGLTDSGVITISRVASTDSEGEVMQSRDERRSSNKRKGLLGVLAAVFSVGAGAQEATDADEEELEQALEEIVVTGSRIFGVNDQFSPVARYDRDSIDAAGFTSVADLVDNLPTNFGGGIQLDVSTAGSSAGVGAQSVNLRGLGAESTLTLLNGRRLAPGGVGGNFIDISAIPLTAIDRVEVLTDGASAIYGSDAIAGVVNIILRENYDGMETRVRVSTAAEGDGDQVQFGQTLGRTWGGGRALISYEYSSDDNILSNDKGFAAGLPEGDMMYPDSERHNVFASGGYSITDRFEAFVDAYYNQRESFQVTTFDGFGGPSLNRADTDVEQIGGTAGFSISLSPDWNAEVSASLADSATASEVFTTGSGEVNDTSDFKVSSYEATVGGPLFSIGGNEVRALIGTQYRAEDYSALSLQDTFASLDFDNDRDVFSAFGEIYAPLIDESNARPGFQGLAVSAAVRYEDYSDVGSSTNPKIGLVYTPIEGVSLRGTYGQSFRAPFLNQLVDEISFTFLSEYLDPDLPGGIATALFAAGSTTDLEPEKAETWTVGIDFEPTFAPELRIRATYFKIEYDDRIAEVFPSFDDVTGAAFGLPIPIVLNPDLAQLQAFIDASPSNFDFTPFGATLADVTVLGDLRPLNATTTSVDGVDISVVHNKSTNFGIWNFSLDVSYLLSFDEQFTPLTPTVELVDTVQNPVDLRIRGGIGWSHDRYSVTTFVNYVDDYENNRVFGDPVPVDSWTTVDLGLQIDLEGLANTSLLNGTRLAFNVRNLFDEDPPEVARERFGGLRYNYDTANAEGRGRTLSLQLSKRW